jgi:hypothetical protein
MHVTLIFRVDILRSDFKLETIIYETAIGFFEFIWSCIGFSVGVVAIVDRTIGNFLDSVVFLSSVDAIDLIGPFIALIHRDNNITLTYLT